VEDHDYPKVSIIVASFNNECTIDECLKSILELDYPAGYFEVIVMDGVSRDATVEKARHYPVNVFSIRLNAPAAYNYAMKNEAKHEILAFIDADAKVEPEWLRKLVPHLEEPHVAGVSGSIETWNDQNPWARAIGYELKNRYSRIGKYTARIATMNLLLKKAVAEEVGGWDENLASQYDTDLGYRLDAKGYRIAYEPSAVCYHYNRSTLRAYFNQQFQYGKNTLKLYFKHGGLAKGDEITDFGMNIQPVLLLAAVLLFLVGIIPALRLLWLGSGFILAFMLVYFFYSAAKIAAKFHERITLRLLVLYFTRALAWFAGATATVLDYLRGKGRKSL